MTPSDFSDSETRAVQRGAISQDRDHATLQSARHSKVASRMVQQPRGLTHAGPDHEKVWVACPSSARFGHDKIAAVSPRTTNGEAIKIRWRDPTQRYAQLRFRSRNLSIVS